MEQPTKVEEAVVNLIKKLSSVSMRQCGIPTTWMVPGSTQNGCKGHWCLLNKVV
jgi:hypothetical protein